MKVKPIKKRPEGEQERIKIKTKMTPDKVGGGLLAEWWNAKDDGKLTNDLCGAASYLKTAQTYRMRQLAVDVRMYCGLSVYSYAGSNVSRMDRTKALPDDRPTFNMVQVGSDTLVSRLGQDEPAPKFLTDGADYKQRHLAQSLNQFVLGEFYQTDTYEKARKMLRDCIVMGTGALKVYPDWDSDKVAVDRVMITDLFVDDNDAINGDPQSLIQLKLMDRDKVAYRFPKGKMVLLATESSVPDNAPDTSRTLADQVMVVEGWRKPSGTQGKKGYVPGRHTIACSGGVLFDEEWHKGFPFVFMNYSDPFLGFWGQGAATQIFGTQMALNRILYTIARAITLVGVPRVFQEQNAKISATHHNNEVGVIVKYSGTKPSYEVAPCNAPEMYTERDKLIQYGLQQLGVSSMQATAQKPTGLNSGEAIRSYDDIATDRQAELAKKYSNAFIDLSYLIVDCAMEIAEETGSYETVYPNKDGTKEINLPQMKFLKDPFVIKCFSESSLPRTPAGRMATVTEQVTSGMLTIKEGRRLLRFPDLEQNEKLENASEERIFKILDQIVEDGKYTMPDAFMDLTLASTLTVQYINLYLAANLEENKAEMLRKFFRQVQAAIKVATPPPAPGTSQLPQPSVTPPPAQAGINSQQAA